jgi:hypothetical protein
MKPIVLSSYLAFAALSLFAADPQTSKDNPNPQPPLHVQTVLSAQPVGNGDSPLVRAAKAANRLGKKPAQVITNETLVRDGGHFTTATTDAQALSFVHTPTGPSEEQMALEARRAKAENAAAAELAKKNEAAKRLAAARAAALAEGDTPEGLYVDPPALEGPMEPVKPSTPETMKPAKPPL